MRGSLAARVAVVVLLAALAALIHRHYRWEQTRDRYALSSVHSDRLPGYGVTVEDLDGDGMAELILESTDNHHILPAKLQRTDPDNWTKTSYFVRNYQAKRAHVSLAYDFTGDGRKELFITFVAADTIWIEVTDLDGNVLRKLDGTSGVHRYGPLDFWDAEMTSEAVFEDPATGHPFLLVRTITGYDRVPRDIRAYDLVTGRVAWRTSLGAYVQSTITRDLDGDGEPEFLLVTSATGNDGKDALFDDRHTYLIALETDGSLRWHRTLGNTYSRMGAVVVGGDGDGTPPRIVTFVDGGEAEETEPGRMFLVNPVDGSFVDSLSYDGFAIAETVVIPARAGRSWDMYVTTMTGLARRYRISTGSLALIDERAVSEAHMALGPFLNDVDGGPLLTLRDTRGTVYLMDRELRVRTRFEPRPGETLAALGAIEPGDGSYLVMMASTGQFNIERVDTAPFPVLTTAYYLLGYIVIALLLYLAWRMDAILFRPVPIEEILREGFLIDHGRLSVASGLAELRERFEEFRTRRTIKATEIPVLQKEVRRFVEDDLPELDKAARIGRSLRNVRLDHRGFRRHKRQLRRELQRVAVGELNPDSLRDTCGVMASMVEIIQIDLAGVIAAIHERFSVEPGEVVQAVVGRMKPRLEREGIRLEEFDDWQPGSTVWGDGRMYEAIVENLISNAIHAMKGCDQQEMTISRLSPNGKMILEVSDTGCGVPKDLQEWILVDGNTTRSDGTGRGLAESARILRIFRGGLTLVRSEVGRGSTFRVQFCRDVPFNNKEPA